MSRSTRYPDGHRPSEVRSDWSVRKSTRSPSRQETTRGRTSSRLSFSRNATCLAVIVGLALTFVSGTAFGERGGGDPPTEKGSASEPSWTSTGTRATTTKKTKNDTIANATTTTPNIVYIMLDDMGYGDVGAFGGQDIATPRMDQLATQGMKLTQYYTAAPVCSATRVSVLTGQHPQTYNARFAFGVGRAWSNFRFSHLGIPSHVETLPEVMGDAGYRTIHIGKWHVGDRRPEFQPLGVGFDEYAMVVPTGRISPYLEETIEITDGSHVLTADTHPHLTAWLIDHARDKVMEPSAQPFFMNLWLRAPHSSWIPPVGWEQKYPEYANEPWGAYAALLSNADEQIGRLVDTIDLFAPNTLVIVASDNGPTNGLLNLGLDANGPFSGSKGSLFEGGVRSAFIARRPGHITPGSTSTFASTSMDLFPTFAELAGADVSELPLDGQSIVSYLHQTAPVPSFNPTRYLIWERRRKSNNDDLFPVTGRDYDFAVRHGPWKLRVQGGGGINQVEHVRLYNLDLDIAELTNIADQHPNLVTELTDEYDKWRQSTLLVPHEVGTVSGGASANGGTFDFPSPGHVSLVNNAQFDFNDAEFTFSILVRPDAASMGQLSTFAGKEGTWRLWHRPNGAVQINAINEDGSVQELRSDPIPYGSWTRVTFTSYPGLRLYIDGVPDKGSRKFRIANPTLATIELGSRGPGILNPFRGQLAGIRMDTGALSPAEVAGLPSSP